MSNFDLWQQIRSEVSNEAAGEPMLASFFHATILNHDNLAAALSFHLANTLNSATVPAMAIREVIEDAHTSNPSIIKSAQLDNIAFYDRDPACDRYSTPFLFFKGFHAIQAYRVAHSLWGQGRKPLALFFQNRISEVFGVDIHPGAIIGSGILLDHAHGFVVGETAVIEDDVSMLHSITLGGTGKEAGDRHPKIRKGVLISAGAKILGNVEVGVGAKVGAGSVVLEDVPAHTTVVGVPAKPVGKPAEENPALGMDHSIENESIENESIENKSIENKSIENKSIEDD
ncbi:MAG: serine O-acetyltransferase [Pseudomonadales bacterium]|nr:serine O-acetyltransferase [Pseudomonadales bacterium]